jgi:hypothetical protein
MNPKVQQLSTIISDLTKLLQSMQQESPPPTNIPHHEVLDEYVPAPSPWDMQTTTSYSVFFFVTPPHPADKAEDAPPVKSHPVQLTWAKEDGSLSDFIATVLEKVRQAETEGSEITSFALHQSKVWGAPPPR